MISATSVAARRRWRLRWGWEGLLALVLIVVLPLFFVEGPAWLATDIGQALANLAHLPYFALLTWIVHARVALDRPRRWLGMVAVVLVVSAAIELIQSQIGRSGSWHDVWRNLVGSSLAMVWLQRPGRLVWPGRIVTALLLVVEISLTAAVAVSHYG